jgi:hypothetical protein
MAPNRLRYCALRMSISLVISLTHIRCLAMPAFSSSVVPPRTLCPPASSLRRTSGC